jgi:hypothetical protein
MKKQKDNDNRNNTERLVIIGHDYTQPHLVDFRETKVLSRSVILVMAVEQTTAITRNCCLRKIREAAGSGPERLGSAPCAMWL